MNIPPDDVNDLNRGPAAGNPIINVVWDIGSAILNANREWTGAHDLAARIAVPIAVLAVTGYVRASNQKKHEELDAWKKSIEKQESKLKSDKQAFESARGVSLERPVDQQIDELMEQGNRRAHQAVKEVDRMQQPIQEILNIKCSPRRSKELRAPLEQKLRAGLLAEPSPFDGYGSLRAQILEDTINILEKDIRHCDYPYPFGSGKNGELYKIYRDNWKLKIELEKYKHVVNRLKSSSAQQRSKQAKASNKNTSSKFSFFGGK